MDLKDTVNAIGKVDRAIGSIVPTAGRIVGSVKRDVFGSWGFDSMLMTPIQDYCLVEMGDWKMRMSMLMNLIERNTTLGMVADSVSGISRKVSDETYAYEHSYTDGNDYLDDFQRHASETTTRVRLNNDRSTHNSNYGTDVNLYYDDNGTGEFSQKTESEYANTDRNSILRKTKQLFRDRKINTVISRFHTDPYKKELYDGTDAKTEYGLSHGRNLLTYDAEHNHVSYDRNGYDNPYCRVWTHHHQYIEHRSRLMRPFSVEDGNGVVSVTPNSDLHKWGGEFKDVEYTTKDAFVTESTLHDEEFGDISEYTYHNSQKVRWGWKSKGSEGWEKSVFDKDSGTVNIAPKFLGGAEKNIHTKDCMFSIENLAWQGYDPYSFEKALSWEQRGPFGGRIMWFPPYGLRFNEDTSVNWNEHSFIGRGENVYTYTNTSRSGTLEFMMVVDHPSILDYSTWHGKGDGSEPELPKDTDIYRFFAGCDGSGAGGNSSQGSSASTPWGSVGMSGAAAADGGSLTSFTRPTPLTDEYVKKDITPDAIPITENKRPEPDIKPKRDEPSPDEEITVTFYVFFPNNYSGYYDRKADSKVDPVAYLLYGKGAQWRCKDDDVTKAEVLPIDFKDTSDDSFTGNGYEMRASKTADSQTAAKNYIIGTGYPGEYGKGRYIPTMSKKWYYRIDGEYESGITYSSVKNTFGQTLRTADSYKDTRTLRLNEDVGSVRAMFSDESGNDNLYTLAEVAYALKQNQDDMGSRTPDQRRIAENSSDFDTQDKKERIERLVELFDRRKNSMYSVVSIDGVGYSNSHGDNSSNSTNALRNDFLADERCKTVIRWFKENYGSADMNETIGKESSKEVSKEDRKNENGDTAKKWRSAKITLRIKKSSVLEPKDMNQSSEGTQQGASYDARFSGFDEAEKNGNVQLYVKSTETDESKKGRRWFYDEKTHEMKVWNPEYMALGRWAGYASKWNSNEMNVGLDTENTTKNSLRYDQEYHFFKKLKEEHRDVFDTLVQKLQYFDPAFHSMTPEGFMGRLNFLHQCTRQGDTISASDKNGHTANNLAFGRPPFCILRLGDFYYQKIVIRNINISYDPLVLDLNNEGIGVVPLIANVTISFNFIGGGDLTGPVRRLQNAMSFNFYANGRLYDNRSDRVEREKTQWDTMGAMGHDKVDFGSSYFHHVQMAK